MAKIIDKKSNKEMEVSDGSSIKEPCKELGVLFSCENGVCGTCKIHVIKGEENLGPLNEQEKDMGMEDGERLACQCNIQKGEIEIEH